MVQVVGDSGRKRKKRLNALGISEIIVENNILSKSELLHIVKTQKDKRIIEFDTLCNAKYIKNRKTFKKFVEWQTSEKIKRHEI